MAFDLVSLTSFVNNNIYLIYLIAAWTLVWKGIALWISARKKQPIWFVILLIINTIGILEILYIFIFSKIKLETNVKENNKKKK